MILYNTLIGICAGAALVLVPLLARRIRDNQPIRPEGWALSFGVIGLLLTFLSGLMAVTWPLKAKPQVNIIFAEPTLFLGVLLLAAALFLWRRPKLLSTDEGGSRADLLELMRVPSWLVFALGLVLASCTIAIFQFTAIGAAPPQEPIMGAFSAMPWVENTLVGIFYALAAVGCLLAPAAVRNLSGLVARIAGSCMIVSGVAVVLYSAMNYYTHIGYLVRLS